MEHKFLGCIFQERLTVPVEGEAIPPYMLRNANSYSCYTARLFKDRFFELNIKTITTTYNVVRGYFE